MSWIDIPAYNCVRCKQVVYYGPYGKGRDGRHCRECFQHTGLTGEPMQLNIQVSDYDVAMFKSLAVKEGYGKRAAHLFPRLIDFYLGHKFEDKDMASVIRLVRSGKIYEFMQAVRIGIESMEQKRLTPDMKKSLWEITAALHKLLSGENDDGNASERDTANGSDVPVDR